MSSDWEALAREIRPIRVTRQESHLSTIISAIRIDPASGDVTASTSATGFFWEARDQWHLVTNIHAITGWHPETRKSISRTAYFPTHLEFTIALDMEPANQLGKFVLQRKSYRVALEDEGGPAWFEHPAWGDKVDVAVLPIFDTPTPEDFHELGATKAITIPVNKHDDWVDFEPAVADDAYVLGFPKGMSGGGFPIWKRGSIASEPDFDIDALPKVLIDTATREGMSGAPVLVVRRGVTQPRGMAFEDSIIGESATFLGVYSGRVGEDPMGVQLGIVWKARVVEEIIEGSKKGAWPWNR